MRNLILETLFINRESTTPSVREAAGLEWNPPPQKQPLAKVVSRYFFFSGAELDFTVLALLVSVFVYSLVGYLSYLKEKKGGEQK